MSAICSTPCGVTKVSASKHLLEVQAHGVIATGRARQSSHQASIVPTTADNDPDDNRARLIVPRRWPLRTRAKSSNLTLGIQIHQPIHLTHGDVNTGRAPCCGLICPTAEVPPPKGIIRSCSFQF